MLASNQEIVGVTEEERYLCLLGRRTFLRFWSLPNLYRDQQTRQNRGDGKEICDLTVIFDSSVIFFSDKKVKYHASKGSTVAWPRWAKRAIDASAKQLMGAYRWFKQFPERVYTDKDCQQRLAISIPEGAKYYFVVVCHGIEEQLLQLNSDASFRLNNTVVGSSHWRTSECKPFCVGKISERETIHVFSEFSIELILNEFDTVKDFISYLDQRELLLNLEKSIVVKSESDLIQLFYENFDQQNNCRAILGATELDGECVVIDKGGFETLSSNTFLLAKKNADHISYFWDELIEEFSGHILNDTLEIQEGWNRSGEIEQDLRLMAQTGRFERRVISRAFIDFVDGTNPGYRGTRLIYNPLNKRNAYLLLLLPYYPGQDNYDQYRKDRMMMLHHYCLIYKLKYPEIKTIVGIATQTSYSIEENDGIEHTGIDLCCPDLSAWSTDDIKLAKELHEQYSQNGVMSEINSHSWSCSDFPVE